MVLYGIYREPQWDRYYATIFSKATLFQIIVYFLLILPPFFIAYATNEFWQYSSTYREQPEVDFLDHVILQISGKGCMNAWSSYPNFNDFLENEEIVMPLIESREIDKNQDGKNDLLHLNISFADLECGIQTVKVVVELNLQFRSFATVTVHSLVYLSESWAVPAYRLWVGGALGWSQNVLFPASGQVTTHNTSVLNDTALMTEDFELRNILSDYNERDVTTYLEKPLVVWDSANSVGNFSLDLELTYPVLTVAYRPGFWQLLKFAWIQYFSIFAIFWFFLRIVQSFVYRNQVVLTLSGKKFHKHY